MSVQLPAGFQGTIRIENFEEADANPEVAAPKEMSIFDKIKKVSSYVIIVVGFALLAAALGMIVSCSTMGFCPSDLNAAQAVFMCGLGAALGGFTLHNGDPKGELQISDSSLPFKYTLKA